MVHGVSVMKAYLSMGLGILLVASLGGNYFQFIQNKKTEFLLQIETKRSEINTDQVNELIASGYRGNSFSDTNTVQIAENQGFIKGINSVIHNISPQQSEVSGIWHAGYERGLSQTDFVGEMNYEKGYSAGYQVGQRENTKALQNIFKGMKDSKEAAIAFEKYAKELQQNEDKKEIGTKAEGKPIAKPEK